MGHCYDDSLLPGYMLKLIYRHEFPVVHGFHSKSADYKMVVVATGPTATACAASRAAHIIYYISQCHKLGHCY